MDLNLRKEQFSIAYIRAIAAAAGLKVTRTEVDDDSIDVGLERSGGCAPKLDVQLKCTAAAAPVDATETSFAVSIKNYDDLRRATLAPRWLAVLYVPTDPVEWLSITAQQMVVRRCAWWLSLTGMPPSANDETVTVHIPYANIVTVAALIERMDQTEQLFQPV